FELTVAFRAAPVDGSTYGHGAHIPGSLYRAEHGLVIAIRQAEEFIMVDLDEEGDLVGIFAAHDAEYAKGGSDGAAARFDGQPDDVLGIEIHGVGSKGSAAAMLNALVYREDRKIAGVTQPAMAQ